MPQKIQQAIVKPPKVSNPTPSHLVGSLLPQEIHQALLQSLPELGIMPEDASVHTHDSALGGGICPVPPHLMHECRQASRHQAPATLPHQVADLLHLQPK